MIVAVASGKGGTGKTTVAASLASLWGGPVVAADLDVEEPNLHLFLRPKELSTRPARVEVPLLDAAACTGCRACADLCQFKAIAALGGKIVIFPEQCHGCGGCMAICPEGALAAGSRVLGSLEEGVCEAGRIVSGRLRVGEAMSPPLIRAVKRRLSAILEQEGGDAVLDCPPGVSCPAINAARDSDCILLITEPTPFGFHDFALAWRAFAPLGKPMGVVVNRAGQGDAQVEDFCRDKGLPVLCRIPYDRAIAQAYAGGGVVGLMNQAMRETFSGLRDSVRALAGQVSHA